MRKKSPAKKILLFLFILLCLLSIPASRSAVLKGALMEWMAPLWGLMQGKKETASDKEGGLQAQKLKNESLAIEIAELKAELKDLKAILKEEESTKTKISYSNKPKPKAAAARIIFRPPLFWSSFVIIDLGESFNEEIGSKVIGKGSPVLSQGALVGVVDWVGKKMSRVRLITDEGLQPSVRAMRGQKKEDEARGLAERLILELKSKEYAEDIDLKNKLIAFAKRKKNSQEGHFLAKGVLQGKSQPLWRSSTLELKGFGFNYDFSDEEGPARDLLTGKADESDRETVPIIEAGDLLVTTGLDGIFPEGIPVAYVKQVDKLKEGDFYYSIRAIPCATHLNQLKNVFVLPSIALHEENIVQLR